MKLTELKALVSECVETVMQEAMSARSLQKGKSYEWTMGMEPLTITYVGPRSENPEIKVGSSVGKGYIFQWDKDGKYMELGPITIYQHVKEIENDEEPQEDSKYDGYVSKEMGGNPELYETQSVNVSGAPVDKEFAVGQSIRVANARNMMIMWGTVEKLNPDGSFSFKTSKGKVYSSDDYPYPKFKIHIANEIKESYQKGYNDAKTKYKKLAEAYVKLQKK